MLRSAEFSVAVLNDIVQMAEGIGQGAIDVALISTDDIAVEEYLANMCREPLCAFFGLSANCPPNVAGPGEFRELLQNYKYGLAIRMEVPMGCLITGERIGIMKLMHEIVAEIENSLVQSGCVKAKGFAAGSCKELFCNQDTGCRVLTQEGECRNVQHARPSIEANGVNVTELIKTAGWPTGSMGAIYGLVLIG